MAPKVRVLIADDQELLAQALADFLTDAGTFEVVGIAADAESAVRLAADHQPDVAILDVRMPGGGGPFAAREIRSVSPKTRVLALSAYGDSGTVAEMLVAGADGYVVKGGAPEEILTAIEAILRGDNYSSFLEPNPPSEEDNGGEQT